MRDATSFLSRRNITRTNAVRPSHLAAYLDHLDQRGLRASTRRRKATSLRVFFQCLA